MSLKITHNIKEISEDNWIKFLNENESANIFQTPFFYKIYEETDNHTPFVVATLNKTNEITGIVVGVKINYFRMNNFMFSRNIIIGGPIAKRNNIEIIKILLEEINRNYSSLAVYNEVRNISNQLTFNDAYQSTGYKFYSHLNFLIDLYHDSDNLWNNLNNSKRRLIKKASKMNLIFENLTLTESNIINGYQIILDVYRRAKLPLPNIDFFISAMKFSNNDFKLLLFSVNLDNKMIGVRFALAYQSYVYGWYAGSFSDYYRYNPNEYLAWNTLLWCKSNGYSIFDFGGAGRPNIAYGVRNFKAKFGGTLVNYGRYKRVNFPVIMIIMKLAFSLYRSLQKSKIGSKILLNKYSL